jgi:hypothetical protein
MKNQTATSKWFGPEWSEEKWEVASNARLLPTVGKDGAGEFWWVPFGEGWEIPAGFEYSGHGPYEWAIWIHVIEGKAECVALRCVSTEGRPITAESLRRLPLGRLVQAGVLIASRPEDEIPKKFVLWPSLEDAKRARAEVATTYRRAKRNPRERASISDDLLRDVARIYRSELAGGRPTASVAEQLHYSRASAGRLVMKARENGFLPLTEPRKARG